jgi:hypothetical protein
MARKQPINDRAFWAEVAKRTPIWEAQEWGTWPRSRQRAALEAEIDFLENADDLLSVRALNSRLARARAELGN